MSEVKGADAVKRRLQFVKREGEVTVARWLKQWGNKYAVHERSQFHKGQPGYWTGTLQRSIGVSAVTKIAGQIFVTIGPGESDVNSMKGFQTWGNAFAIQATALEYGAPYKAHFVSYKNNPMFELWASQHGFKTTNKAGQVSGGLMVGGKPDSILQRGIHYKASADAVVLPQIAASREMLKNELQRLADKARATVS